MRKGSNVNEKLVISIKKVGRGKKKYQPFD